MPQSRRGRRIPSPGPPRRPTCRPPPSRPRPRPTEGKGTCYDHGWEFNPVCETTYGPASSTSTEGHMVESETTTTPYVSFTVGPDNLMVIAAGPVGTGEPVATNGYTLVQWWQEYPWPWITGG